MPRERGRGRGTKGEGRRGLSTEEHENGVCYGGEGDRIFTSRGKIDTEIGGKGKIEMGEGVREGRGGGRGWAGKKSGGSRCR